MKKGLKTVGTIAGIAALAAILPYGFRRDKEKDELTVNALLWQFNRRPDPEAEGKHQLTLELGFHNSFYPKDIPLLEEDEEPLLMEETVEDAPCVEISAGPCDTEAQE